jgi:hypothetical protein
MHLPQSDSVVLVLSIPPSIDPAYAGAELQGVPGIASVTAYPERGQLLVRFDPKQIAADEVRALVLPEIDSQVALGPWLVAWPRVAGALPIAASWL